MTKIDIIRAWKDPEYRASLSSSDLMLVPVHPAGSMDAIKADYKNAANDSIESGSVCDCASPGDPCNMTAPANSCTCTFDASCGWS